jgi:TrmH family RNA methyltransferase
VLVRPETAANVGRVARAMRNTGLAELRLVRPGDWRTLECWRSAWGAHEVLEQARVFDDLASAVADCHVTLALSGRDDLEPPPIDVRAAAAQLAALAPTLVQALVFGPETAGLTLAEIALCGRRAHIPAHAAQPSLNLAQAVMVTAYEVFRARLDAGPNSGALTRPETVATHAEKDAALELLRAALLAVHAVPQPDPERVFRHWRAFFHAREFGSRDLRRLMHVARKVLNQAQR